MAQSISKPTIASTVTVVAVAGLGAYSLQRYFASRNAFAESPPSPMKQPPNMAFAGGFGLMSLRLHSVKVVNHNTKRLLFELPDKDARCGLSLTSALLTFSRPNGNWLPVIRPYTPINDFNEPGYLELMIKKYPNGKASSHLHSLQPGQTLSFIKAPIKGFPWTPNQFSQIYLLAGGAGITPIYQLIQGILNNPADTRTKMTLVFGVNTEQDLLLRDEFEGFKKRFPGRFDVVYAVSELSEEGEGQESASSSSSGIKKGRITEALLKDVMKGRQGPGDEGVKVFVCGPPPMEASLTGSKGFFGGGEEGILAKLGYTKGQIYKF